MHFDGLPSLVTILPILLCFACEGAEDMVSRAISVEGMAGQSCGRGISETGMPRSQVL